MDRSNSSSIDNFPDYGAPVLVEGFAHVVAVEGGTAWLEPEQTSSCGACSSASACGAKGIGTLASRLEARRFSLPNLDGLRVGERVVVGVSEKALVKASLTAYAMPLATTLFCGAMAQWVADSDLVTMAAMVAGLGLGLFGARLNAGRLNAHGELSPHYLRRADTVITCHF